MTDETPDVRLERRTARPTRRGLFVAALGVMLYGAGANVSAGWVVALSAALLGALPLGWVMVRRAARSLTVARVLPPRATAGVPVSAGLRVSARAAGVAVVRDRLTGAAGAVSDLRGGTLLAGMVTLRRGHAGDGPVDVTLTDLFGLVEQPLYGSVPSDVVVEPAVPPLAGRTPNPGWAIEAGTTSARSGAGPEVVGVREYQHGDPLRAVHWRSTARRGNLVVRELADEARPRVVVALGEGEWHQVCLDRAAEAAAAIAADAAEHGLPAAVAADGWSLGWSPPARRMLALLPPHTGAAPRPLAHPPTGHADVLVHLAQTEGRVEITVTAGGETRALGALPQDATAEDVGRWLSARAAHLTAGG